MKKIIFAIIAILMMASNSVVAQSELAVYESNSKLSFACPDNTQEIQDTEDAIHVQTPDLGFSVVAAPFFMSQYTEDQLAEALVKMAVNAGVDLSQAGRLSVENDDIVGEIFAAKDDDGTLYVYSICGNDERGYLIQVIAHPSYHSFVDAMFETISIED